MLEAAAGSGVAIAMLGEHETELNIVGIAMVALRPRPYYVLGWG